MFVYQFTRLLLLAVIGAANAIPQHLICCSAETGTFQTVDEATSHCWHEKLNKSTSLPLTCPLKTHIAVENLNITITESEQVFHIDSRVPTPLEFTHGDACFGNDTDAETGEITEVVVLCMEEPADERVLGYCMLVSAIFFFLTASVYAILPEVRDLQGKSIINFCVSMGLGLSLLCYQKLTEYSDMTMCAIRGFLIYFLLIASFFWTNAISIQMLLSLSYIRPVVNNYGWKEFLWYALYAWGCPTILTVAMAIVNFHPGQHMKPGIGLNTCWFYTTVEQWYYMYSVMTLLIAANICIFIYTSIRLWRFSFSSTHVKALKYKFIMSLRMIGIMGITWIFEMISSLTEKHIIWAIIDVFNALQGPLIFLLIVVLRKRVIKALLKRGYLDCVSGPVERYLAARADDEEGVIQHTIEVSMHDRNGTARNGI